MNMFKQIVFLDDVNLSEDTISNLRALSEQPLKDFRTDPEDQQEIEERISGADCVLVSWRTAINKEAFAKCPDLSFICLCGTSSQCIDMEFASQKGIVVSNVKDYGDQGVVEWIFYELTKLLRGFDTYMWKDEPSELSGKKIGILGLGAIGKLVADAALGYHMQTYYYSRTRNLEFEGKEVHFLEKKDLIKECDIIILATPKNLKILEEADFNLMKEKILVNPTLGYAFDEESFNDWIALDNNFYICDIVSDFKDRFKDFDRVLYSPIISGRTQETKIRLSAKVEENISSFLGGAPINKIN